MIETLGKQLNGDAHLAYLPSGFVYVLDVPLSSSNRPIEPEISTDRPAFPYREGTDSLREPSSPKRNKT